MIFDRLMSPTEARLLGFPVFNDCPHIALDWSLLAPPKGMFTVSVKLPDAEGVTACFLSKGVNNSSSLECVGSFTPDQNIARHSAGL